MMDHFEASQREARPGPSLSHESASGGSVPQPLLEGWGEKLHEQMQVKILVQVATTITSCAKTDDGMSPHHVCFCNKQAYPGVKGD